MKAIVTGGCGFIGSNLVDSLIEQGYQVSIIDDLSTGCISNLNNKAEIIVKDITTLNAHNYDLFEKCDVIFHLAALPRIQPSFKIPRRTLKVNCFGTVNVLEMARKHGCKVVYAGSSSFYGNPNLNPYAHSKWIGEEHCKMYNQVYGISTVIARFFNVYGKRQIQTGPYSTVVGIFEYQKKNNIALTVTGDGSKRRDFTHVLDIVDGLIAMSKDNWNGDVFNLGRGQNHSILEVAQMFDPERIEYIAGRPGEATNTLADISDSTTKLMWTPTRNIEDYIASVL